MKLLEAESLNFDLDRLISDLLRWRLDPTHLQYLVVDVEVSLSRVLWDNSTLLQQEVGDLPSIRSSSSTELDLKVFTLMCVHMLLLLCISTACFTHQSRSICTHESAGVVVPWGFGVPEGLEQRVRLQDDIFNVLPTHTWNKLRISWTGTVALKSKLCVTEWSTNSSGTFVTSRLLATLLSNGGTQQDSPGLCLLLLTPLTRSSWWI